jgi:hypothetical protein
MFLRMKHFVKMSGCSGPLFCHIEFQWAIEFMLL